MKVLSMDTSTRRISLAVSSGGQTLATKVALSPNLMESNMIPNIDRVLRKAGQKMGDIDVVVVGLGPGSFTGLRVGLATAKGLAFAGGARVLGVSSLDALAYAVRRRAKSICVITDARRQRVYHAGYESDGVLPRKIVPDRLCSLPRVLETLNNGAIIVGDAVGLYRQEIEQFAKDRDIQVTMAPPGIWAPRAKNLAAVAANRLASQEFDDQERILPCYLYADDCQVRTA